MDTATVPNSLKPTDSAQNPYSLTPLSQETAFNPGVSSPTYGSTAYNTALSNSGMTINSPEQQATMATANPLMANPVAGKSYAGDQIKAGQQAFSAKATAAAAPPKTTAPASTVTPPKPVPAAQAPVPSLQSGAAAPTPKTNNQGFHLPPIGQPTQEQAGYFLNGQWQKPTDLRYSGYYVYGGQAYAPGTLGMAENFATWVDPLPSPFAQQQNSGYYGYGQPGQAG